MKVRQLCFGMAMAVFAYANTTMACTRVLKADHAPAVMVGRTMDWSLPDQMPSNIWVYPRGIERYGLDRLNSLHWVSKYGSIVTTAQDEVMPVTTDGMNEAGLAVHLNMLNISNYGERNPNIPGMLVILWAQYYLDNFKTVAEAVKATDGSFQITPFHDPITDKDGNVHLAIEDASGDSAIIEYVDGKATVYWNRDYTVMANEPAFSDQLHNLQKYQGVGGSQPLPGTSTSPDRFVRGSYYIQHLPEYTTVKDELAGVLSVLDNVSIPYGVTDENGQVASPTVWRVVSDLTNHVYYFSSRRSLSSIYVTLDKFNLREGSKPMRLVVRDRTDLSGDVTKLFEPVEF